MLFQYPLIYFCINTFILVDIEMDYKKHYDNLILNSKHRIIDTTKYYENHHIVPKCLNGDNSIENLVLLTPREHYIAHALLCKIYTGTSVGYKLASAFNFMCLDSHKGNRFQNSKTYDLARKFFSKNHPTLDLNVRVKISNTLKQYYTSDRYLVDKLSRKSRKPCAIRIQRISVFCECGCGETFTKKITSQQRFIVNHSQKILNRDNSLKEVKRKSLKNTLDKMSVEEMALRMKQSTGKADPISRGLSISKGKRGKSTNQNLIEIKKYGSMSDEEFEAFIITKSYRVHNRIRNKRKTYYDNRKYYDNYTGI